MTSNHPIADALRFVAAGGTITDADLDALPYPKGRRDETRAAIRRAATDIAQLRADGEQGNARRAAAETAARFRDIDTEAPADRSDLDALTPDELAARIPRV